MTTDSRPRHEETVAEIVTSIVCMLGDSNQPDNVNCDVCIAAIWTRVEDLAGALHDPELIKRVQVGRAKWDACIEDDYGSCTFLRRVTPEGEIRPGDDWEVFKEPISVKRCTKREQLKPRCSQRGHVSIASPGRRTKRWRERPGNLTRESVK
jgi:hypothetical protein